MRPQFSPKSAPDTQVVDYCSRAGALELARRIEAYWAGRGYVITAEIRADGPCTEGPNVWGVRSTLIRGLPAGAPLTDAV